MSVFSAAGWKVAPGRDEEFLKNARAAKQIHERLGGKVRLTRAVFAGANSLNFSYTIWHANYSDLGRFSQRLATDAEWLALWSSAAATANPAAVLLGQSVWADLPGFEGPPPDAGAAALSSQAYRIAPGRSGEVAQNCNAWRPIAQRFGLTARFFMAMSAGPDTGTALVSSRASSIEALFGAFDKLVVDPEWLALNARAIDTAGAPATSIGSTIAVTVEL